MPVYNTINYNIYCTFIFSDLINKSFTFCIKFSETNVKYYNRKKNNNSLFRDKCGLWGIEILVGVRLKINFYFVAYNNN